MRSIVGLLLKHARAGLGYVKNFVKNTNQPEPKKIFTLKTRIKNLGSDPRAIWCGFLRGFVDTKKGNKSSFNQPTLWFVLVTLSGLRPSHTFEDCQRNMTFYHNSVRLYLMVPGEI